MKGWSNCPRTATQTSGDCTTVFCIWCSIARRQSSLGIRFKNLNYWCTLREYVWIGSSRRRSNPNSGTSTTIGCLRRSLWSFCRCWSTGGGVTQSWVCCTRTRYWTWSWSWWCGPSTSPPTAATSWGSPACKTQSSRTTLSSAFSRNWTFWFRRKWPGAHYLHSADSASTTAAPTVCLLMRKSKSRIKRALEGRLPAKVSTWAKSVAASLSFQKSSMTIGIRKSPESPLQSSNNSTPFIPLSFGSWGIVVRANRDKLPPLKLWSPIRVLMGSWQIDYIRLRTRAKRLSPLDCYSLRCLAGKKIGRILKTLRRSESRKTAIKSQKEIEFSRSMMGSQAQN